MVRLVLADLSESRSPCPCLVVAKMIVVKFWTQQSSSILPSPALALVTCRWRLRGDAIRDTGESLPCCPHPPSAPPRSRQPACTRQCPPQRDPCTSVRFLTAVSFDLVQLEVAASGLVFLRCRRLCWEVGHMGVHVLWSLPSLAPLPCPSRHSPVCDPSHGWLAGCQQALLQEPEVGSEHVRACADREHCCLWRDHGWQTSRGSVSRAGSPRPRLFVLRGAVVGLGGIHTRRVRSTAPRLSVMGANMRIAWCASALHMS